MDSRTIGQDHAEKRRGQRGCADPYLRRAFDQERYVGAGTEADIDIDGAGDQRLLQFRAPPKLTTSTSKPSF